VLRTLAPVFLLTLLVSSFWLPQPWRTLSLAGQGLLYASGWAGYWCQRRDWRVPWLSAPFYFCFGNLTMLAGLVQYAVHRERVTWGRS
jgi:hypothetical protein